MLAIITLKILFLLAALVLVFAAGRSSFIWIESKISYMKDTIAEKQYCRRLQHTKPQVITDTDCRHICGMTFGKQISYEQDFYLGVAVGERRNVTKKVLIAPEINFPVLAPRIALEYIKFKMSGPVSATGPVAKKIINFFK